MTVDFGRAARGLACFAFMGLSSAVLHSTAARAGDDPPGVFFARDRGQLPAKAAAPRGRATASARIAAASARHSGARFVRASWYGGGERLSRHTASGQRFNPWGLTAAHRTLPLGTRLQLTLGGRSVVVTVTDRGPARSTGRTLDVSRGAARALGFERAGTASLAMSVLG